MRFGSSLAFLIGKIHHMQDPINEYDKSFCNIMQTLGPKPQRLIKEICMTSILSKSFAIVIVICFVICIHSSQPNQFLKRLTQNFVTFYFLCKTVTWYTMT